MHSTFKDFFGDTLSSMEESKQLNFTQMGRSIDPLAVICSLKRKGVPYINNAAINSFLQTENSITVADLEKAYRIRNYYSRKLMVLVISGQKLTKYRQDLNSFLHNSDNTFTPEFKGLIYTLPDLYDHDVAVDELYSINKFNDIDEDMDGPHEYLLEPLRVIKSNTRGIKRDTYWFNVCDYNIPAIINVNKHVDYSSAGLIGLWHEIFIQGKLMKISADWCTVVKDRKFLQGTNWRLANKLDIIG